MRSAAMIVASIALIAAAALADEALAGAWRQAARSFDSGFAATITTLARVALLGAVMGLTWAAATGARSRMAGAAMAAVGLYVALLPIYPVFVANTDIPLPPLSLELNRPPVGLALWAATAVAIVGLVNLIWPTHSTRPAPRVPADPMQPVPERPT